MIRVGVVEETRQVIQDFLAPELREMRGQLAGMQKQLESMDKRLESQDKRQELHEEAVRARFDVIVQRLETIQQSFAFDKRISDLEADKRRSA
jgi:flagellar capping protein FliD